MFTPKLVTAFREGYGLPALKADAVAGLTVAIVALPLSMAIAIASGVSPDRGLTTAIVGGFLVSLFGGSRFQIGGPAGAFILLVAATVAVHGIEGLILATFLSGLMLAALGALRLGTFIKYIPYPVTVGFTAGIAVVIAATQLKEFMGLTLGGPEPGELVEKLFALAKALPTLDPPTLAIALLTLALIALVRRFRPHWPSLLIAVAAASIAATAAGLDIATIGSRFGGIPSSLPMPRLPVFSLDLLVAVLPAAVSFALLGAIESLLSAVVADSMSGRRHRSNCELVAQGIANVGSSLFGGFCVTGTIARTATNVRAGARSPVAGMLHAAFLLVFVLVAAPLAAYVPLAALAAVLLFVAWNMAERHEVFSLLRSSRGDALVLTVTFLLVIFRDLTTGIVVGFSLGALLFLHRMAGAVTVEGGHAPLVEADRADGDREPGEAPYGEGLVSDPEIFVCRISGAFFFAAAGSVGAVLDRIAERPRAFVLDMAEVPFLDSSAAATIVGFDRKARRDGAIVVIAGAGEATRRLLSVHQEKTAPPLRFSASVAEAVAAARAALDAAPAS
ncbi:SulP family inorganic anion transporter [Aurantimonas sp. HBX-1]|uniref:SulP family inorganic anion transporter n=1 Tax=Aurantimonas sp. HBX-1 TaxID=2906072 RepID=UPI001F299AB8|nr:SulP family inorganic anion transporter [Aurantimonas sp. HBX-1]UIJ74011.1 SulP family inorganic anion transporter [Aurantimonas sp. HBX-1]